MSVQKPTLVYFHVGGRGEVVRLLLELAGADYHYQSISFRNSPGEPWTEYKEKHEAELTFGQVPLYQEPGKMIHATRFFVTIAYSSSQRWCEHRTKRQYH